VDKNTNELISNSDLISNKLGEYFYKNSSNSNFNTQFKLFKQKSEKAIIVNSVNENPNQSNPLKQCNNLTRNRLLHKKNAKVIVLDPTKFPMYLFTILEEKHLIYWQFSTIKFKQKEAGHQHRRVE